MGIYRRKLGRFKSPKVMGSFYIVVPPEIVEAKAWLEGDVITFTEKNGHVELVKE